MGSYIAKQDLIDSRSEAEVLHVADREGTGDIDDATVETVINQGILETEGLINSYIGIAYDLPLTSVPDVLISVAIDICMYKLAANFCGYTDELRQRYEDAINWLKRIADGKATLGLEDEPEKYGSKVLYSSNTRLFTRTSMRGL